MADIQLRNAHGLSHQQAKAAAQTVADNMAAKFDMSIGWHGDVLKFERSGVSGTLAVSDRDVLLEISLAPFFKFFQGKIEASARANMAEVFGAPG